MNEAVNTCFSIGPPGALGGPISLCDGADPLERCGCPSYSGHPMSDRRYTTVGLTRGECGHKHRSLYGAVDCLAADEALCVARGRHTDRRIFAIGPGLERELNEIEIAAVSAYRATSPAASSD